MLAYSVKKCTAFLYYFVWLCVGICMPGVCMEVKTQLIPYLLPPHDSQVHLAWWASTLWASAFTHWTILWAQKCIYFFFLLPTPSPSSFLSERGSQVVQAGIRLLCSLGWLWTSCPLPLFLGWGDYRLWLHTQFCFCFCLSVGWLVGFVFWLLQTEPWLCVSPADVLPTDVSSFLSKNIPGCLNFTERLPEGPRVFILCHKETQKLTLYQNYRWSEQRWIKNWTFLTVSILSFIENEALTLFNACLNPLWGVI